MLSELAPAQRFMYEYGCFVSFWSNFDLLMEVAICDLSGNSAMDNCKEINSKTAGQKRSILKNLLTKFGKKKALDALDAVFDVADRNGWLHGHILNPNGDFSTLRRLRITKSSIGITVDNSIISLDTSPFIKFYECWEKCAAELGLTKERCNRYINDIMAK